MLDKNFNAECSIKKWANAILIIGKALMCGSPLAALIVLCIDAEYLWWVSLVILGGSGLMFLFYRFIAIMIWGFGDLIGNTKRMSCGTVSEAIQSDEDELPEL